jgi:hypothetical protein
MFLYYLCTASVCVIFVVKEELEVNIIQTYPISGLKYTCPKEINHVVEKYFEN